MIQWLKLIEVVPYAYRSRNGGGIKLKFDSQPVMFAHIHRARESQLEEWTAKIGQTFVVSSKPVKVPNGDRMIEYLEARVREPF